MVDFHLPQRWAPPRRPAARGMALPLEPSAAIFASFAAASVVLLAWLACSSTIWRR